jgi:trans-aconitate 2-methyltransferase
MAGSGGRHREWNAASYARISGPQAAWADRVMAGLDLAGDERVLDVGCGTGTVTEKLVELVPRGRVIGVDGSQAMADHARAQLGDRADVIHSDILELELDEPVDLIFSNATLHWITDHDALFARLHALLTPGGRIVAQCGGAGNLRRLLGEVDAVMATERFAAHFEGFERIWSFPGPEETDAALWRAGFEERRAWLSDGAVAPDRPREFLSTVVLRTHLESLPEAQREPFLDAVMERVGERPTLDYIRLNIEARRGDG